MAKIRTPAVDNAAKVVGPKAPGYAVTRTSPGTVPQSSGRIQQVAIYNPKSKG